MEKFLKYAFIAFIAYLLIKYVIVPLGSLIIAALPVILVVFAFWIFCRKL